MNIIVTGGTGFIGSHVAAQLISQGHGVTIIDDLSNSSISAVDSIASLTGTAPDFVHLDLANTPDISKHLPSKNYDAVMHFAGLKSVAESVEQPLRYYDVNLISTINLLRLVELRNIPSFIFSSSATVYGKPEELPILEAAKLSAMNPYGRTKLMIEDMLRDFAGGLSTRRVVILRYFNPVGAHPSGLLLENPKGTPNNLMPFICRVAKREQPFLSVFGNDFDTEDGTGVRDYIHVMDLAEGHIRALNYSVTTMTVSALAINLGTGRGVSVLEMIEAFKRVNSVDVPYVIVGRRNGDVDSSVADATLSKKLLGWHAKLGLDAMCRDAWRAANSQH